MWICRASASLAVDALSCVRRRTSQECPNDRWIRLLGVNSGTGSRRTTEPAAEPPGKIRVVGKAAGIGNLAERLPRAKHLPAMNEAGGVVEANRLDEAAAGGVVRREEVLQVSQRDPGLGRRFPALPTTRILPGGSAAGSVVRRDPVPERASTANDTDRGRPMSNTPVDLSATDVSFAIIEALRPWSSAVYRGKGCAGAQREDVEHGRRRSNKVQVKDLMPYSPTLAPSRSHHAFRL
jgi:hypothetical protein